MIIALEKDAVEMITSLQSSLEINNDFLNVFLSDKKTRKARIRHALPILVDLMLVHAWTV